MNALFIDINFSVQFAKVDLTMKILALGAGVLGCNLTRNLFRTGKDITLLTRGKWTEEIQKNGLRIKDKFFAPNASHPNFGCGRAKLEEGDRM